MEKFIRKTMLFEVKAGDGENVLDFAGSTEDVDRDGDIIELAGWDLKNYKKNPVFLWAHDYSGTFNQGPQVVLGAAKRVWKDTKEKALKFSIQFSKANPWGPMVHDMYAEKTLRATSVGFIPREVEERKEGKGDDERRVGFLYKRAELLELSAVPVPSNPNALALSFGRKDEFSKMALAMGYEFDKKKKLWSVGKDLKAITSEYPVEDALSTIETLSSDKPEDLKGIEAVELEEEMKDHDGRMNYTINVSMAPAISMSAVNDEVANQISSMIAEGNSGTRGVYFHGDSTNLPFQEPIVWDGMGTVPKEFLPFQKIGLPKEVQNYYIEFKDAVSSKDLKEFREWIASELSSIEEKLTESNESTLEALEEIKRLLSDGQAGEPRANEPKKRSIYDHLLEVKKDLPPSKEEDNPGALDILEKVLSKDKAKE